MTGNAHCSTSATETETAARAMTSLTVDVCRLTGFRGFSLTEICIALLVMALLGLVFCSMLQSGTQRLVFTANSFAAVHLASKALTDLQEESRIHGMLQPVLEEFPELAGCHPVLDGQSPYFRQILDRQAPFGRLDNGEAGGIMAQDVPLYDQLAQFTVEALAQPLAASDAPGSERHLSLTTVRVAWREPNGQNRSYDLAGHLPDPVGPRPPRVWSKQETTALEPAIKDYLFPDLPGRTFAQAAVERGLDRELAFHVGKVALLCKALQEILDETSSEMNALEERRQALRTAPTPEIVDIGLAIARRAESGATTVFHLLLNQAESIAAIRNLAAPERLRLLPANLYHSALTAFTNAVWLFPRWLLYAADHYQWLLEPALGTVISGPQREIAQLKTLEALRLLTALRKLPPQRYLKFISARQAAVIDRNPVLARFLQREERLARGGQIELQSFANLAAIVRQFEQDIGAALQAVPGLRAMHPGETTP